MTHEDLLDIINNKMIILKGQKLNGKTKMDATNYYVQAGELKDVGYLLNTLSNIKEKEIIINNIEKITLK